ncbi:MAG: glycosyltransferase, partial [Lysobacterales bacterium]
SSLLGHSLDALRTDLPTVVVNHDYAAWWPELHADFGDPARDFDRSELSELIARGTDFAPMPARSAAQWTLQREELLHVMVAQRPAMVAPTAGLRANLLRIEPALAALEWHVIAHGLRPFADVSQAAMAADLERPGGHSTTIGKPLAPAIDDVVARPRLLIPGRLNGGKGDVLLGQCIQALAALADVWLVGCGPSFERYLGISGVHILFDYDRDELPALIARIGPQLALLPVSVAESYSYVLSELRALGVPTLATALGAYRDRIEEGVDGFLVAPDADAIVSRVGDLLAEPQRLLAVREQLAARPVRTLAAMRDDYATLLPRVERSGYPLYRHDGRAVAFDSLRAEAAATARHAHAVDMKLVEAQAELERRADWVARTNALFRDRSHELTVQCARADALGHELSVAEDHRAQVLAQRADDLAAIDAAQAETRALDLELQRTVAQADAHAAALARRIDELVHSRSWRITAPLRRVTIALRRLRARVRFRQAQWLARGLALRRSLSSRGFIGTLAQVRKRRRGSTHAAAALDVPTAAVFAPFEVPRSTEVVPRASVVVPVFNHFDHTLTCLRALAATADPEFPFEVIVVDDASTDETRERLAEIGGIVVHRHEVNAGFIAACNAGLGFARGEFVVFLNNDTAVQPGWLSALLGTFVTFPDTGLAGAKLVYPDGRLQEAGGIVFADASGWNYGRFESPDDPRFNYVREVDYCSGAAIALPRMLLVELGGFDPLYAPAYYEDTDLAMRVRAHGLKVRFQPASVVVHFEGISSGTDTSTGTKRYQPINQAKFAVRWRDALQSHPAPGSDIVVACEHRARGRLLIVDACTPMPDHDSGSLRMWNLLRILVAMDWKIVFVTENMAHHGRYTSALQALGVECLFHPAVGSLPTWLAEHGQLFDAVMLSRHTVATPLLPLVREYAPQAKLVFDTVDLHFLREERAAAVAPARPDLARTAAGTRSAELALVRASDVTVVVSPVEQALLRGLVPQARIEVLSNVHAVAGRGRSFADRSGLLFVGGFQHEPNVDAVEWLLDAIWPRLSRALPGAALHIVGSRMPDALRERCAALGAPLVAHGFVE